MSTTAAPELTPERAARVLRVRAGRRERRLALVRRLERS